MRVISGIARGKNLKAPPGNETRPITDMIKEALFNVLGPDIQGTDFLDLFAGSGSVGIEALSRGADRVVFIDNSSLAVKVIQANLAHCHFTEKHEVFKNDVFKAVDRLKKDSRWFDYIYIDPPFTQENIFPEIMRKMDGTQLLKDQGTLIIRTPRKMEMPAALKNLQRVRHNHYGESTLHYYQSIIKGGN